MDAADPSAIVRHAIALRHELHRHPELSWQERRSAELVRRELSRLNIPWQPCAETGTLARLAAGRPGRHLALRADLDALPIQECSGVAHASCVPGVMHACGHDGHTACLLAAAAWLKAHEAVLPGPVTLLFQPAEEGGHGARRMVEEGALRGVDAVFAFHNWSGLPAGAWACPDGPVMAANGEWTAVIRGRGGHAGSPHDCIDPLLAGAHFVVLAQQLVSRATPPQQAAVVSVTMFHAGSADNAIPDSAELTGTIRAATSERREALAAGLERVLAAACAASGARGELRYRPTYPATINHPAEAARARAALAAALGPAQGVSEGFPLMAAEDFAYMLEACPGAYILLGTGHPEPCHSPRFDFDDRLIPAAMRLWAALAGLPPPAVAVGA
ncbi:MAG: M20 family metallopeptidase [Planctomycetota bacterium]|nr:M20 family metallopeptidase [Planctomycetota bacterium]MDW8373217.1 M20 family metallopeptidase [Planctomycetota bacterium]